MQAKPAESTKHRNLGARLRYPFYLSIALTLAVAVYYIFGLSISGFSFMNWSYYYILMGLLLPFVFLLFPMSSKAKRAGRIPWYDLVAAALAFVIPIYLSTIAMKIDDMGWSMSPSPLLLVMGIIVCALVLESARRTGGNVFCLVTFFLAAYPLFANLLPGASGDPLRFSINDRTSCLWGRRSVGHSHEGNRGTPDRFSSLCRAVDQDRRWKVFFGFGLRRRWEFSWGTSQTRCNK